MDVPSPTGHVNSSALHLPGAKTPPLCTQDLYDVHPIQMRIIFQAPQLSTTHSAPGQRPGRSPQDFDELSLGFCGWPFSPD